MLRVVDIMSRHVHLVEEPTPIREAARTMREERVGSLIVARNGMPTGIVTEADLTRVVAEQRNPEDPVSTIMTAPLYYSHSDADIREVANAMTVNRIKKIPVMSGSRAIGIVTQTDIIRQIVRVVRSLAYEYCDGHIDAREFAKRSNQVFNDFDSTVNAAPRNWYMRCNACDSTFMNPERDGQLQVLRCPKCDSSDFDYDLAPEL